MKAIIFDCFGVLVTDGWLPFKRRHFGHDADQMARATELNHQVDAGLIDYQDFVGDIADMTGVQETEVNKTMRSVVANEALLQYIGEELKPRYKIGLLSNVSDSWLRTLFTKEQLALFDAQALSYEMGVIKPNPRAYEIAAERLDVSPEDCVFIDDQEGNVTGARTAGMKALQFRNLDQLKVDLAALLQG
jgi:HAD superfamily hydrolase (TIGR01509 family)